VTGTARDIALIVLLAQALVLSLTVLVAGIMGSIALIETTVRLRRGLRRLAQRTDRLSQRVEIFAQDEVLARAARVQRARAMATAFLDTLLSPDSPHRPDA